MGFLKVKQNDLIGFISELQGSSISGILLGQRSCYHLQILGKY